MVESVDTPDLKSCGQQWPCRFDPGSGHLNKSLTAVCYRGFLFCLPCPQFGRATQRRKTLCRPQGRKHAGHTATHKKTYTTKAQTPGIAFAALTAQTAGLHSPESTAAMFRGDPVPGLSEGASCRMADLLCRTGLFSAVFNSPAAATRKIQSRCRCRHERNVYKKYQKS